MTTRENDIRVSANATDPCPTDITGVSPDACSVITNASHADITNRIYAVPPTYTVAEETLPTDLQSKLDLCDLQGTCNFVSYDFETDTGVNAQTLPYVINTRTTTTENSSVLVKKRNVLISSITAQGSDVLVTTTTPHNFMVGGNISLSVTPYVGDFVIKSTPSSTTFTYEKNMCSDGFKRLDSSLCSKNEVYSMCAGTDVKTRVTGQCYSSTKSCPVSLGGSCPTGMSYFTDYMDPNAPPLISCFGRFITPCVTFTQSVGCKPTGTTGAFTRYRVSETTQCEDIVTYTIPTPSITPSSNVTYTPPMPVELNAPPGYDFNSLAIVGTPVGSVITNATEVTCAQACDTNTSCVGFNFSSIGDTCQMFSSVTSSVATSEASFRKENLTSNSDITNIQDITNQCATKDKCNDAMLKNINQGVSFSTTNLAECRSCPPRTFKKQSTSFYVRNEFGSLSILNTVADAVSKISFSSDIIPTYADLIQKYTNHDFDMINFKTRSVLFSFRFAPSMTSRGGVESYWTYNYNGIGLKFLNGTYITYQPGNNTSYKDSWFLLEPVPDVKNGYFIKGLNETYSASGELTSRNSDYYLKYNNGFYSDVNGPLVYDRYSSEYASFVFVINSKNCPVGSLLHPITGCTPCPENWYCPAGTIGIAMMINCPYGTSSPVGSADKSQCVSCPVGDPGANPTYSYKGRCVINKCTLLDPNGASAALDTSGVCRVTCKSGYVRNSLGICTPCSVTAVPGDPGTSGVYSDNCTLTGCTTTDPHASGATIDATGACRNTCRYQKGSSGSCTPCPGVSGDPGTTPLYLSTGCTVTACTTTTPNAYGAAPNTSGACITTCMPGFQKNSSGLCDACSVVSGDPGTFATYSEPGSCTPSSCTSTDPFATVGQSAYLDSGGACRNNCRNRYTRNSSGSCIPCASQNPNGDPYTSVAQNPDWISSGGSCSFLCIVTLVNDSMIASITGARQDASGNCRVSCTRGYRRTTSGSCEVCPNSLPTQNDSGTTAFYKGYTGGNLYTDEFNSISCDVVCTTTDANASSVSLDANGICRNTCKTGYQKSSTGACTACTGVNGWGDAGTSVISFSSGCTVSGCATTDPNAFGAGYTTMYTTNGDCINYCKTGFQRDFTNNQGGKCTACPVLTNTGGDTGTTLLYTASGTCSATGCTTTDPNASSAENSSGVCRNVCKPGYTRNSSGTCVTCTSLNDAGASATSYSSGCIAASCTTTDTNASGAAPDATGACRNTCKAGYTRDSTGKCVACNPPRDAGTTVNAYSSGCIAASCTTTDVNASAAAPDTSGVCRNTCKTGYQKNSLGTCVACTNLGDSGTTPTAYLSGCFVSTCTTTDTNASIASPDTSGVCRNICKPGYKNSSGVCTTCPQTRLVLILKDSTNGFNEMSFYVQYIGTTAVVGRVIYFNNTYWKILTATGVTFVSSWVTTYGLSSTSGTICTVRPMDIYGNLLDTNPLISPSFTSYSYYPNVNVPYCLFDYSNCLKGDAYTTATYSASTCSILQCTTSDTNASSVASDGSVCRNTCKKNFERNTGGMCVPKPCQTSDPNSLGADLVAGSCRTMCNIGYSLNSSSICEACPVEYLISISASSIFPVLTDGCYMLISSDKVLGKGMVVQYNNNRYVIVNAVVADVSPWINIGRVPNRPGYGVDVYAVDSYGNKISNPLVSGNAYKNIYVCNSV